MDRLRAAGGTALTEPDKPAVSLQDGARTEREQLRKACQEILGLFGGARIDAVFPLIPGAKGPRSELRGAWRARIDRRADHFDEVQGSESGSGGPIHLLERRSAFKLPAAGRSDLPPAWRRRSNSSTAV